MVILSLAFASIHQFTAFAKVPAEKSRSTALFPSRGISLATNMEEREKAEQRRNI